MLKHIVHVPRRFVREEWGGTETTILQLCRAFLRKGIHSDIYTSNALATSKSETLEGVAVKRFSYFYPFLSLTSALRDQMDRKGGNLFSISLLFALLSARDLDLIHLHTGKRLGGIVRTVARLRRIPYVMTLHGGVFDVPEDERRQLAEPGIKAGFEWGKLLGALVGARRVLQDADALICVGQNEAEAARKALPGKRILSLPNGVDSEAFKQGDGASFRHAQGIPEDSKVILCLSRIDYQKNQLALIEALPQILCAEPKTHLLLIGPVTVPSYQERLQNRIDQLQIASSITQLPGIGFGDKRLFDAFQAADIFNLPSLHEPFGIVILEAWAAGVPVVAAKVGGIPSFTRDEETVLWIDPSNTETVVNANLRLLQDASLAARLSAAGKLEAKTRYDWSVIGEQLEDLYQQLISERSRA